VSAAAPGSANGLRDAIDSGEAGPILALDDLRITSRLGGQTNTIVAGVDLTLSAGETLGIVGESGSGKSMLSRAIVGLLPRGLEATGGIRFGDVDLLHASARTVRRARGRDVTLLLQDPFTTLNPLMRAGRQVTETFRDERGKRPDHEARRAQAIRLLAEVGIDDPDVADRYPFQLSGGMRQRVGLAAALAGNPKVLIADEPTTALDVTTQREILLLLRSVQAARGMGLVLITHDLSVAFSVCDRVMVLYAGSMVEVADARPMAREPLHPYTLGLRMSEPPLDHRSSLAGIPGSVPSFDEVADRCPFAPRCRWVEEVCTASHPVLTQIEQRRWSACVRVDDIRDRMRSTLAEGIQSQSRSRSPGSRLLVVVDGLVKRFRGSGRASAIVEALKGVSIEVVEEESVGLVGESGSGKTTLARCLVGLETPSEGTIVIDGREAGDLGALSPADRDHVRRTIQVVFQDPYSSLNPVRTVGATLREALTLRGAVEGGSEARVRELLDVVGLPGSYAERKPVALSGGERQRVAIARALAVEPDVLICDEPVSALDVSVQAQILDLFRSLQSDLGLSYIFISHDLAVIRQVVDRAYVLYRGEIVEAGPIDEVLDHPRDAYTQRLVASVPRVD
jgi:peptide/nickel transport system ATP-binding protein